MNQRVHLLASLALTSVFVLGCNQEKKEASPEPTTTAAAPATTAAAPGTTAEDPDKAGAAQPSTAEKTGDTNPEKSPTGAKTPTATVAKGEKAVTSDGKDLNVKNESGKGSVKTTSGGTTVTGKSGKSITVPGL